MANTTVTLFVPCLIDGIYPEVGEAVVAVFDRLQIPLAYPPDQTCCGQPAYNAGHRRQARIAARHFIRIFESAEVIVCPSGSCVHMVRDHYPALFRDSPRWLSRARAVACKTFEFCEYLVDVLNISTFDATYPITVTYHDSCHLLRGLGVGAQPRKLIGMVKGVKLIEMHDSDVCCGFGGSFAIKYPEISTALVADKVVHIEQSGAEAVVGGDMGCLMNIQGYLSRKGSPIKILHVAQVLAGK